MNILFLTISRVEDINNRGIYTDLLRYFVKMGHKVFITTPVERRLRQESRLRDNGDHQILEVKTLNIKKTNVIEKGIGTVLLDYQYGKALNRIDKSLKFDLILYSTPPITLNRIIEKIKKRDNAKTYLLLKDIFPQNAVDIGLMKRGILHNIFRKKEKKLYQISDYIGCMSPANVEFVLKHNPDVDSAKVEVCPNSIELEKDIQSIDKAIVREKFGVPVDSTVFVYGGNLGKPQGIDFLLKVLETNQNKKDRFFLIVGSGTEYDKIYRWFEDNKPGNAKLISVLPKQEYDSLVRSCDVGLIFLDPRFTIPNYPSRLLSYLENRMPVIMATDVNTDIGKIAEQNGYGYWCENGDLSSFNDYLDKLSTDSSLRTEMGDKGYKFLEENYTVEHSYNTIMKHFE